MPILFLDPPQNSTPDTHWVREASPFPREADFGLHTWLWVHVFYTKLKKCYCLPLKLWRLSLTSHRNKGWSVTWSAFDLCQTVSKCNWPFKHCSFLCRFPCSGNLWQWPVVQLLWPWATLELAFRLCEDRSVSGSWCGGKAWRLLCSAGLPLVGPVFQSWVPKPARLAETPPSLGPPSGHFLLIFSVAWVHWSTVRETIDEIWPWNLHIFLDLDTSNSGGHCTSLRQNRLISTCFIQFPRPNPTPERGSMLWASQSSPETDLHWYFKENWNITTII